MYIGFYGSSLVSTYWNGAATYYRGLLRALAARGHRITFFEPDIYERQKYRDMDPPDWAEVVVYEGTEAGVRAALQQGRGVDVLVKTSGVGAFDNLLAEGVLQMRGEGRSRSIWMSMRRQRSTISPPIHVTRCTGCCRATIWF